MQCKLDVFSQYQSVTKLIILVVDDDLLSLELLLQILAEDYTLKTARSGQEALELLSQIQPDLILLDIVMPEMDGYSLYRRIRKLPECTDTPILFLSCMTEREAEEQSLEIGAIDYLTKPFNTHIVQLFLRSTIRVVSNEHYCLSQRDLGVESKS